MRTLVLALIAALVLAAAPAQKKGGKSAEASKAAAKTEQPKKSGKLIDVNAASAEELKSLPGIGDAYSRRIIDNRPYRSKNEIVSKAGVPQSTYEKIKDQIIAHQVKGAEGAGKAKAAGAGKK